MDKEKTKKVMAYFDGFNYYEALRAKKWRHYYWQDFVKFCELFLRSYQELESIRYFTAIQHNKEKADRQDLLFQANKINPKFDCYFGDFRKRYKWKNIDFNGKKRGVKIEYWEEKKSDVALASYMIRDVAMKKCDVSFLFCADSDLTPAIDVIKELSPIHKIIVFFPPGSYSYDLRNKATKIYLLENHEFKFKQSLLPTEVILPNEYVLKQPDKWK